MSELLLDLLVDAPPDVVAFRLVGARTNGPQRAGDGFEVHVEGSQLRVSPPPDDDLHRRGAEKLIEHYRRDFDEPTIENIARRVYLGPSLPWSGDNVETEYRRYVKKRESKQVTRLPRRLEAVILLAVAELRRVEGDLEAARSLARQAAEEMPEEERSRNWLTTRARAHLHRSTGASWYDSVRRLQKPCASSLLSLTRD